MALAQMAVSTPVATPVATAKLNFVQADARGDDYGWGAQISLEDVLQRVGRASLAAGVGAVVLEVIGAFKGAVHPVEVDHGHYGGHGGYHGPPAHYHK